MNEEIPGVEGVLGDVEIVCVCACVCVGMCVCMCVYICGWNPDEIDYLCQTRFGLWLRRNRRRGLFTLPPSNLAQSLPPELHKILLLH